MRSGLLFCVCMWMSTCREPGVEVRRQVVGAGSLPLCGSSGSISGYQAWYVKHLCLLNNLSRLGDHGVLSHNSKVLLRQVTGSVHFIKVGR